MKFLWHAKIVNRFTAKSRYFIEFSGNNFDLLDTVLPCFLCCTSGGMVFVFIFTKHLFSQKLNDFFYRLKGFKSVLILVEATTLIQTFADGTFLFHTSFTIRSTLQKIRVSKNVTKISHLVVICKIGTKMLPDREYFIKMRKIIKRQKKIFSIKVHLVNVI